MARKLRQKVDVLSETISLVVSLAAVAISGNAAALPKVWGSAKKIDTYVGELADAGFHAELEDVIEVVRSEMSHEGVNEGDLQLVKQMVARALPSHSEIVDADLNPEILTRWMKEKALAADGSIEFRQANINGLFDLIVGTSLRQLFKTDDFREDIVFDVLLSTHRMTKEILAYVVQESSASYRAKELLLQVSGHSGFRGDVDDHDALKAHFFQLVDQYDEVLKKVAALKAEGAGKGGQVVEAVMNALAKGDVDGAKKMLDAAIEEFEAGGMVEAFSGYDAIYHIRVIEHFREGEWEQAKKLSLKVIDMFRPIAPKEAWLRATVLGMALCKFGTYGGEDALNAGIEILEKEVIVANDIHKGQAELIIVSSKILEELGAAYTAKSDHKKAKSRKIKFLQKSEAFLAGAGLLWDEEKNLAHWAGIEIKRLRNRRALLELLEGDGKAEMIRDCAQRIDNLTRFDRAQLGDNTYLEFLTESAACLAFIGKSVMLSGHSYELAAPIFQRATDSLADKMEIYSELECTRDMYEAGCEFTGTCLIICEFCPKKDARTILDSCLVILVEGIAEIDESEYLLLGKCYFFASMVHAYLFRSHGLKRSQAACAENFRMVETLIGQHNRNAMADMINPARDFLSDILETT